MTNVVLALALVFADHMVLQRDTPVPVWGTGTPGESVTVEFAGQTKTCVADATGKWRVTLDPLPANAAPQLFEVSQGTAHVEHTLQSVLRPGLPTRCGSRLTRHDILVGDVWVCAGQSNMEWPLAKEAHAAEELPAATNPRLRLLNMPFAGQYFFAKPFGPAELARMTPDKFYSGTWQPCTPESAKDFSAVGYYFGKEVSQKVPVGLINLAVGGSPAEAWIRRAVLPAELPLDPWCLKRIRENLGIKPPHPDPLPQTTAASRGLGSPASGARGQPTVSSPPSFGGEDQGEGANRTRNSAHPFMPGFLWEAGIARLIPVAIRGVLWYQGESNAETDWRVEQHETLFPLLVRDWRTQWGREFPFLFVQLSSLNRTNWPAFRDQQRRLLDTIPNTGMVVTSDIGHPTDVHPRNKRDVGHRLALLAMENRASPLPRSAKMENGHVVVTFTSAELKTSDGQAPRGFEVAGRDGAYRAVAAELRGATAVLPAGAAVRYAWQPFTDANVVDADRLPASTFQLKVTP